MKTHLQLTILFAAGSIVLGCDAGTSTLNEGNGGSAGRGNEGGSGAELAPGGAGGEPATSTGGVANTGGRIVEGGTTAYGGAGGAAACTSDRMDLGLAEYDAPCPETFCEAVAWATDCDSFGGLMVDVRTARFGVGWGPGRAGEFTTGNVLELGWGTHSKTCIYAYDSTAYIDIPLVGIWTEGDILGECRGTSYSEGGDADFDLSAVSFHDLGVCENGEFTTAEGLPSPSDTPPALCFNFLGQACYPCCSDEADYCAGQPDGYPGYQCAPREESNYCSCDCRDERLSCGC